MNILHHKSWHVRNKDNIERVRKDEENAKKDEEERLRRVALAESEARTELLRNKSTQRQQNKCMLQPQDSSTKQVQHINFFSELEEGKKLAKGNKEYEKEKKEEKEKQEKAIGLLTYLGQSAVEAQVQKPWYLESKKKRKHSDDEEESNHLREEKSKKFKYSEDPMRIMSKYVDVRKTTAKKELQPSTSKTDSKHRSKSTEQLTLKHSSEKSKKHKKQRKKDKKKKKKKKHKRESSSEESSTEEESPVKAPGKSIEQLRAERLMREQGERRKTKELMLKLSGNSSKPTDSSKSTEQTEYVEYDDRKRSYHSQFNPDLVRKPKRDRRHYLDDIT